MGSLVLLCSWTGQPKQNIRKAHWLIGVWENKTSRGSIYECWLKVSDKELSGKSYMIKLKDTVLLENVRLTEERGQLFYIPSVINQNNGEPVRFKLKYASDKQLVFENPGHDFPQTITYTKKSSDSLVAEISGWRNTKLARQTFSMKKIR